MFRLANGSSVFFNEKGVVHDCPPDKVVVRITDREKFWEAKGI